MPPRRHDQGDRKKKGAPTAATVAKRADNNAAKGAAKAAVQAAQAAANGSALLAGLGAQQQPTRSQRWLVQRRQFQRWLRPQPLRRLQRRRTQANQPSSGGPMLELTTKKHDNDHTKREHDLTRLRREPFHVRATRACTPPLVTSSSTGGSCQQVSINICVIVLTLTN